MNENQLGALDALIQEKLSADTEFQNSLAGLNDEEIAEAKAKKEAELRNAEFEAARKYGENQKIRAEKAEGKSEKPKDGEAAPPKEPEETKKDEPVLSYKDSYALTKADVHIDDIDDVIQAAKVLGKDISSALDDDIVKGILKKKSQERSSADAANIGLVKPGNSAKTGTDLLKDLSEGKAPEPGSVEAEELFWARRGGRRS